MTFLFTYAGEGLIMQYFVNIVQSRQVSVEAPTPEAALEQIKSQFHPTDPVDIFISQEAIFDEENNIYKIKENSNEEQSN